MDVVTLGILVGVIAVAAVVFLITRPKQPLITNEKPVVPLENPTEEIHSPAIGHTPPIEIPTPKISWSERLFRGLERTRQDIWSKLASSLKGDDGQWDQVEEILYGADLSPQVVEELIDELKSKRGSLKDENEYLQFFYDFLLTRMGPYQKSSEDLFEFKAIGKTKIIMIVGVNGAGKTTTIGKLATKLRAQGAKVLVGACDTFRAAAVDQLQVWCERAGAEMVRAQDGADPSGVAYDTVARAIKENYDYCLIDTAGRLHTNANLMEELAKTKRVMAKLDPVAPHEILLVLDAITGQNALRQAQEFNKALQLTGLIFTKCDGSAKAGSAVGIVQQLKIPITYIGVGEGVEDLNRFELAPYLKALVGLEKQA